MRNLMKVLLLMTCFRSLTLAQPTSRAVPLSVCELLADRMKYNGQMVTVKGEGDATSEGTWLSDESCRGAVTIGGRSWGKEVALVSPDFAMKPVDFQYDDQAEERLQREFKKLKVNRKTVRVFVTYEGLFETRPDSELQCEYCGFGHLGGSPAQLVIKTKRDLVVKPRQSNK